MTKGEFRFAMRNVEDGMRKLRKAIRILDEVDPRSPLLRANNFLMDWLDTSIVYRDNAANWRDGKDEQSSN